MYKIISRVGYYFSAVLLIIAVVDAVWYKTWYMIPEGFLVAILFTIFWTFLIRIVFRFRRTK